MLRLDILQTIKKEYESGTNIISYLKNIKKQLKKSLHKLEYVMLESICHLP